MIRDAEGGFVAARAHQIPFIVDPLMAEALVVWHAITFGSEVGIQNVILEGDSLVVMSDLKQTGVCNPAYGQVIEDIRSSFLSFSSVGVNHVKRGANMAAHLIAKYTVSQFEDKTWRGECPLIQTEN